MHKRSRIDAPPPVRDGLKRSRTIESREGPPVLKQSVSVGQYLNRVATVTPDALGRGDPPETFPTVEDAESFAGMYVVTLPAQDPLLDRELGEDTFDIGSDPVTAVDDSASVRLFDLRLESAFEVSVRTFRAHDGLTIWNTGQCWDIE